MNMTEPADFMVDREVAQLRTPPHSIEAESSVLSGLLMDNGAWDRVGDMLNESDFYRYEHRRIFGAIASLVNANKPADVVTVFEHLKSQGKADEAGGLPYINTLAQYVPSAANIRRYAEIVRERSLSRRLVAISDDVRGLAEDASRPFEERVEMATASISKLLEGAGCDAWQSSSDGVCELLDRMQAQADGTEHQDFVSTGFADVDESLNGGLRGGELVIVGARPGMGKTSFALRVADHVAGVQGAPVAIFTMEMPRAQLQARRMAMRSRVPLSRIKRAERLQDGDWARISEATDGLARAQVFINDQSGLNINQLRARARGIRRRAGSLGLIVVDYLGLMTGNDPKQPRTYQLEQATKGLKDLSKEMGCPVLLLCQLNRAIEQRADPVPMLSDLRDSGAIEQDADIVMLVHRDIVAKPDLGAEWRDYAKLFIAKQRDGETGTINLMYTGEFTLFQDWPRGKEVPRSRARVVGSNTAGGL